MSVKFEDLQEKLERLYVLRESFEKAIARAQKELAADLRDRATRAKYGFPPRRLKP
jgi:hypothetical protein